MEDKMVMMPQRLTAANGGKSLMIGEFFESLTITCPHCGGDDEEFCDECETSGTETISVPVSWTTIKKIYAKAVEHFAEQVDGAGRDCFQDVSSAGKGQKIESNINGLGSQLL